MLKYYILDGHFVKEESCFLGWCEWFGSADRIIDRDILTIKTYGTRFKEIIISTVFLGIDHNFFGGKPLLFETMIFGGPIDGEMKRCSTWKEAIKMHESMCLKVSRYC